MNNFNGIGRLTRDPDVRYTSGENPMAVARFSIAIDTGYGEHKRTDFPSIVVLGKQAENCERFLKKGKLVGISGRVQTGSYTNKEGATVYTTEILANRIEFLSWDKEENSETQTEPQSESTLPTEGFSYIDNEDIPF